MDNGLLPGDCGIPFTEAKGTPLPPIAADGYGGWIEVFGEYVDGLSDLARAVVVKLEKSLGVTEGFLNFEVVSRKVQ